MKNVAVIVGRFQAHKLTDGHKELINYVISKCDKLIIFVGVYPKAPNFKHPLPFEMREWMLLEFIPSYYIVSHNVKIIPIYDVFNIPLWSENLDKKVDELTSNDDNVTLYGSRDSFIFNYNGKYKTEEIESHGDSSATDLRNEIKNMDIRNVEEEFRKGIIWALRNT